MSREILFKAKRKNWKELPKEDWWVEGYYIKMTLGTDIKPSDVIFVPFKISRNEEWGWMKIDPTTICQYTGLTDKNGKKIWENDILRYSHEYEGSPFLKEGEDVKYRVGAVFWSEWRGSWAVCGRGKKKCINNDVFKYNRNPNRTEVIGNVFDNPELLEVE